jgi:hypothetical protein
MINHVSQKHFVQQKFAHSRSITLLKNILCYTNLPIHDQSRCAKIFSATQICSFTMNFVAQKYFVKKKLPIHDHSRCSKIFCATQICPFTMNHVAQECFVQQ